VFRLVLLKSHTQEINGLDQNWEYFIIDCVFNNENNSVNKQFLKIVLVLYLVNNFQSIFQSMLPKMLILFEEIVPEHLRYDSKILVTVCWYILGVILILPLLSVLQALFILQAYPIAPSPSPISPLATDTIVLFFVGRRLVPVLLLEKVLVIVEDVNCCFRTYSDLVDVYWRGLLFVTMRRNWALCWLLDGGVKVGVVRRAQVVGQVLVLLAFLGIYCRGKRGFDSFVEVLYVVLLVSIVGADYWSRYWSSYLLHFLVNCFGLLVVLSSYGIPFLLL